MAIKNLNATFQYQVNNLICTSSLDNMLENISSPQVRAKNPICICAPQGLHHKFCTPMYVFSINSKCCEDYMNVVKLLVSSIYMNISPHFKSPTIIKIAQVVSNLHLTFLSIACKKDMEEVAAARVSNDHKRRKKSLPNFSVVKS